MSDLSSRFASSDRSADPPLLRGTMLARNWWAILIRGIAAMVFGAIVVTLRLAAYAVIFGIALIAFALRPRARHMATTRPA